MTYLPRSAGVFLASVFATSVVAAEHEVRIISDYENLRFVFEPSTLVIQPGDTVVWVNDVSEEHNVISYPGGIPNEGTSVESHYLTEAGETFRHTFTVAGTYQYHCLPHLLMGMTGEVVVSRRSTLDEFHIPSRDEMMTYRLKLLEWFDEDDNLFKVRLADKSPDQPDHQH
ncbi:MAG: plastocyanin/azurin family copper-binding protein [Paracoccaceae bacterium]|nr:plastocyanin/azurin family copper-binding protein [Paracoccaceae bacterium]